MLGIDIWIRVKKLVDKSSHFIADFASCVREKGFEHCIICLRWRNNLLSNLWLSLRSLGLLHFLFLLLRLGLGLLLFLKLIFEVFNDLILLRVNFRNFLLCLFWNLVNLWLESSFGSFQDFFVFKRFLLSLLKLIFYLFGSLHLLWIWIL
jgi:hypothetical protein